MMNLQAEPSHATENCINENSQFGRIQLQDISNRNPVHTMYNVNELDFFE
jgi:hypothetical protein